MRGIVVTSCILSRIRSHSVCVSDLLPRVVEPHFEATAYTQPQHARCYNRRRPRRPPPPPVAMRRFISARRFSTSISSNVSSSFLSRFFFFFFSRVGSKGSSVELGMSGKAEAGACSSAMSDWRDGDDGGGGDLNVLDVDAGAVVSPWTGVSVSPSPGRGGSDEGYIPAA